MRRKNTFYFLAAYFLAIFLWLSFCYKQVQKACISAGHSQETIMEVISRPENAENESEAGSDLSFFSKGTVNEGSGMGNENALNGYSENGNEEDGDSENSTYEEGAEETIRVVLTGDEGIYHKKAVLRAGGEELEITPNSVFFADTDILHVRLSDGEEGLLEAASLDKACGHPCYEGFLEIRKEGDKLVLINELPLESYVEGVLPSEMPSSYPLEALKAQAVCARTYAEMKQENKAYPEYQAAVDDSTACQVYRNMETSGPGNKAVEETAGEVLVREDSSYAECYYYSTSCGRSTTAAVWHGGEEGSPAITKTEEEITLMNQDFFDFIREKQDTDIEAEEPFYRWDYRCEKADYGGIFTSCRQRQGVNADLVQAVLIDDKKELTEKNLGKIKDMDIAERQEGGAADCLRISCEKGTVYVWGEYNIRCVLAQGGSVTKQDGTAFQVGGLLPSAFLSLQSICNEKGNMVGYIAVGGGFGHGVGMSQNGAKQMAASGSGYQEILAAYYPEAQISTRTCLRCGFVE